MTTGPAPDSPLKALSTMVKPAPAPTADSARGRASAAPRAPSASASGSASATASAPAPSSTSPAPATAPATTPAAPTVPTGLHRELELPPLLEGGAEKVIAATYGARTLLALRVASLTKPLLILRGNTGVGKSTLALQLLDDPRRERSIAIPVAATWRGREDLLGYVNPVSNEFEPTAFTRFLFDAAAAWRAGDRRARIAVFEEFNLSQPEHWLSDVLVVSQYVEEKDRVIHLGGKSVRGLDGQSGTALFLSPAVRFVATMNSDHTTRTLSPRVIDRAAIVELDLEPREALQLVGLELPDEQLLPITEIDELLRAKGATFSRRSAASLRTCEKHLATLEIDRWAAIDVVLVQEVLSKVRLLARDPADEGLMHELTRWSEKHGRNLPRTSQTIENWNETLRSGADVVQS